MKYFFEAGVGSIPAFSMARTAVKASGTDAQPDAAGSVLWGLGSFPNKQGFRVTKALLAEEWVLKKSFKIWKDFRLILFVSWSRI